MESPDTHLSASNLPAVAPHRQTLGRGKSEAGGKLIALLQRSAQRTLQPFDRELASRYTLEFARFEEQYWDKARPVLHRRNRTVGKVLIAYFVVFNIPIDFLSYSTAVFVVALVARLLAIGSILAFLAHKTFVDQALYIRVTFRAYFLISLSVVVGILAALWEYDRVSPAGGLFVVILGVHSFSGLGVKYVNITSVSTMFIYVLGAPLIEGFRAFVTANLLLVPSAAILGCILSYSGERARRLRFYNTRKIELQRQEIGGEKLKSDLLLSATMPSAIARRLRRGETTIVDAVANLPVVFIGIIGMDKHARSGTKHARLVSKVFAALDEVIDRFHVEPVKSISDSSYMVTADFLGLVDGEGDDDEDEEARWTDLAGEVARFALAVRAAFSEQFGSDLAMRMGISTGPVVCGVIGSTRISWDAFGDTVNVAARLMGKAPAGDVLISDTFAEQLRRGDQNDEFTIKDRGRVLLKGKGMWQTYALCPNEGELHESLMSHSVSDNIPGRISVKSTTVGSATRSRAISRSNVSATTAESLDEKAFVQDRVHLRKYTLRFRSKDTEDAFWEEQRKGDAPSIDTTILAVLIANVVLLAMDLLLQHQHAARVLPGMYGVFVPGSILCFLMAKSKAKAAHGSVQAWRKLMSTGFAFLVVGTLVSILLADGGDANKYSEVRLVFLIFLFQAHDSMTLVSFLVFIAATFVGYVGVCLVRPAVLSESGIWPLLTFLIGTLVGAIQLRTTEQRRRTNFVMNLEITQQGDLLREEKTKTDRLLYSSLPPSVVRTLLEHDDPRSALAAVNRSIDDGAVLQLDLMGFTALAAKMRATQLVVILNSVYALFDDAIAETGLQQLVPRGDAYVVLHGLPTRVDDGLVKLVRLGQTLAERLREYSAANAGLLGGHELKCRVGIGSGELNAGVLGRNRFVYDAWGPALDRAGTMEPACPPMNVLICERTWELVKDKIAAERYVTPTADRTAGYLVKV